MTTNEEIREFAETAEANAREGLPQETEYQVMAARPFGETEAVTGPIRGYYHALYVRDQIEEQKGYAGVSFHLEEV